MTSRLDVEDRASTSRVHMPRLPPMDDRLPHPLTNSAKEVFGRHAPVYGAFVDDFSFFVFRCALCVVAVTVGGNRWGNREGWHRGGRG